MLHSLGMVSDIVRYVSSKRGTLTEDEQQSLLNMYGELKTLSQPKSIASESKSSIFDYPFLISSNVSQLEHIAGIMKGCEIEYANMIILMSGVNPTIDNDQQIKIKRTLSKYHTSGADYSAKYEDYSVDNVVEKTIDESWKAVAMEDDDDKDEKGGGKKKGGRQWGGNPDPEFDKKGNPNPRNPLKVTENEINSAKAAAQFDGSGANKCYSTKVVHDKYANMFNMTIIEIVVRLDSTDDTSIKIPIGVHGTAHHLPFQELIYVMTRYITGRAQGFLNRFIRWTSGEIKGLHNLLFRYSEIKSDIEYERRVGTSNSWIKVLRSRANNRRVNILQRSIGLAKDGNCTYPNCNDILPDCTFVISMGDVDVIEQQTGINIFQDPIKAKKFLDDAMGLGLVIVDDVHDIVHVLFASYTKFQSNPIKAFASEYRSKGDNTNILIDLMKKLG